MTHTKENGFIITQYPSSEEVGDFFRLLMAHDCSTVICLDPLHIIESVGVIIFLSGTVQSFLTFSN